MSYSITKLGLLKSPWKVYSPGTILKAVTPSGSDILVRVEYCNKNDMRIHKLDSTYGGGHLIQRVTTNIQFYEISTNL